MDSSLSKTTRRKILFYAILAGVFVLQVWKAFRGMGSADEHFYTTLGYRFAGDDRMFADDWHIAQMISFFLDPLVSIYLRITHGTEGIQLFMRLVYAVCLMFTGYVLYLRFEPLKSRAAAAAMIYLLYTPFQIMALSYNTMSVMFVILAVCAYPDEREEKLRLVITGLFASFAVINTPYLALLYVFLTIVMIVKPDWFSRTRWAYMTLGVLCAMGMFLAYVFLMTAPKDVLASLGHLIDPSHSGGLRQAARNIALLWRFFHLFLPLLVLEVIAAFFLRGKPRELKYRYFRIVLILSVFPMVYAGLFNSYQENLGGHGTVLLPAAVCGLVYLILFDDRSYPAVVFRISVFHACMILISSNVGPRTWIAPLILACSMTMLFAKTGGKPHLTMMGAVLMILLLYGKAEDVYDGSGTYNTMIARGPLKGLRDSPANVQQYYDSLEDIRAINGRHEKNAVLLTWNCWEYLALNKRIASFSTYPYFWEEGQMTDAQELYWEEHPDRLPSLIYLDRTAAVYDMQESDPWFAGKEKIAEMKNGVLFITEGRK
ncbi:MAG: hypothetical protein IKD66_11710 [Solobacterium sp.]|nr:hypothetical protein [Solobacterium sp.]